MKKSVLLIIAFILVGITACNNDDNVVDNSNAVAFVNTSANVLEAETEVKVVFSKPTTTAGTVTLSIVPSALVYGTDFTTTPAVENAKIVLPYAANVSSVSFNFKKIVDAIEGEVKNVKFTIASISDTNVTIATATNSTQLNFNETAVVSKSLAPENGGNTVPNQVFVDLSSGAMTKVVRTSWDLGFYGGSEFRVISNGAINKFAVKQLNSTNIDEVQVEDPNVTTGNYEAVTVNYIDNPYGNLTPISGVEGSKGTAIAEVSEVDVNNKVYLVNLGQDISTVPGTGTGVALTGAARGWKKIRILRDGANYKLQYADLNATTHNEVTITKNAAYNFTFFSLNTKSVVNVEPLKEKWDLNITAFTGETFYGDGASAGAYYFPDYAITNTKVGTRAYQVLTSEVTYESFNLAKVVQSNFETELAKDQRVIGGNWRATYPLAFKTDRFYVIKDVAGNLYKLKFTAMLSATGERGNVSFEYALLK
ncbi:HmuY family protein [Flavobacterium sp. LC2016-12]|uniref:HmuY family protein n=1 Tax=Flavobacterium sp. LC2016-12 TaxID=2783794 RepID=UPI00188A783E|nr:HmuY family protein [Flavobacterium sp. LC2016-12]MBF4465588.1 HmuY family protein [Flavobacterium sp. LC2016-12]